MKRAMLQQSFRKAGSTWALAPTGEDWVSGCIRKSTHNSNSIIITLCSLLLKKSASVYKKPCTNLSVHKCFLPTPVTHFCMLQHSWCWSQCPRCWSQCPRCWSQCSRCWSQCPNCWSQCPSYWSLCSRCWSYNSRYWSHWYSITMCHLLVTMLQMLVL